MTLDCTCAFFEKKYHVNRLQLELIDCMTSKCDFWGIQNANIFDVNRLTSHVK